jgi:hypothetical protein
MATRSTIWIKKDNGNYDGIYCHWDGYLDNNGKILIENYQDVGKIKGLIELGSLSSLDEEIDCPTGHSYETPKRGCCVAYHRDRDEDLSIYRDITFDKIEKYFEEYNYFYIDGEWKYTQFNKNELKDVAEDLKNM